MSANAATVSITLGADGANNQGFTLTSSTISGTTRTLTLTKTGDLDGQAISDDTLTFELIYDAFTGSTLSAGDVSLGTAITPNINNVNWHNNAFTAGNRVSFSIGSVTYTDGEGNESAAFNGFTSINPTNYASSPAGNLDYYVGLVGATTVTGDPTFSASLGGASTVSFTAAGGPVRLRNLAFSFEIVPEPSSAILLGLGLSGFTLLRRRA